MNGCQRVSLFLKPQRVLGKRIYAETQRNETCFMELLIKQPVAFLMDSQLAGQFNLQLTPDNLFAHSYDQFRHAVQITLVKHEQVASLGDEPL